MLSRRTFVQSLGAASFAAALPVGAGATSPPEPLPRRAIPGTDESLAQETGTAVTCVISGTSNPKHVIDNLSAGYGRLPDPDYLRQMEGVIRALK